jgi:DNA-binding response OmpR family regulator
MTDSRGRILVVDDDPRNVKLLNDLLAFKGYEVITAASGVAALEQVATGRPDLVLLDVLMPGMSGYEVCRALRADSATQMLPVVMVTALDHNEERTRGLEAGADEFLTKPIHPPELLARVRSLLRIKSLHDTVQVQARQLAAWNAQLEQRVAEQMTELGRLSRLKRFVAPQLAELIVSGIAEDPLASHRREVTVVFLDLRGFTGFAETATPDEVMTVLRDYHATMGRLAQSHRGTLERFTGDAIMIFFNDPVVVPDPTERAVKMAVAMRDAARVLGAEWSRHGFALGLGIGIAHGFATIGAIGFENRIDYGAIGTVTNLAARLCAEAAAGEILVERETLSAVEPLAEFEVLEPLCLRGFSRPVEAARILGLRPAP